MNPDSSETTFVLDALSRLRQGEDKAREELIGIAQERLRLLASRMLKHYPSVGRWEQTDDVLQSALIRLHKALSECPPVDQQHFLRLSTLQIRRTLIDLARHYRGPEGMGANHDTHYISNDESAERSPDDRFVADTGDPKSFEAWSAFHECVARLPEQEREVFELLFYQGLSQAEAAATLGVVDRTIRRHWTAARLRLAQMLRDQSSPGR